MSAPEAPRSGRCAIVGRPNAGKSTLLNALLGQKLAIATPKPQTTRTCILGVYVRKQPPLQIAFVDTPGLHRPENALGRALLESAKATVVDADVVLLLAQVSPRARLGDVLGPEERGLLADLGPERKVVLAINKVDKVKPKGLLLPLLQKLHSAHPFAAIVPISALRATNLDGLIGEIAARLPEGLRYDAEQLTDKPERFFAAELVREAVLMHTREEVPYATAVVIERFTEEEKIYRIAATIIVEKDSQKGIIIGAGGSRLKQIGTDARLEIEQLLERKVFLELWVKVEPDWTDSPAQVRELVNGGAPTEIAG
jgi:GTP-binding protein Era